MVVTTADIIRIPISTANIQWAAETAIKKFQHTHQGFRGPRNVLDELFQGDLAKNALISYLTNNGQLITDEYDRVRNDNFTMPNNYGYVFFENGLRVEVNSSKAPNLNHSIQQRLSWYDLKVTAGDNGVIHTMPHQLPYDISYQMYFETDKNQQLPNYNRLCNAITGADLTDPQVLTQLINQLIIDLDVANRYQYNLLGYARVTPTIIENIRLRNQANGQNTTWSFPGATRDFWVCKLRDCDPI